MAQILLIDDELALTSVLRTVLSTAGHAVVVAGTAADGLRAFDGQMPDVVLLDLGLPDMDGKGVIEVIRAKSDAPIIIISARHQQTEKISALDEGADDYIDKPFEIGELMARIRVALRRQATVETPVYSSGPLAIDFGTRQVMLGDEPIRLSPKEYDLLVTLARSAGRVVTHKRLLAAAWAGGTADTQYLRVYVGLLRQKIEDDPSEPRLLLTEPGVGYRLQASET